MIEKEAYKLFGACKHLQRFHLDIVLLLLFCLHLQIVLSIYKRTMNGEVQNFGLFHLLGKKLHNRKIIS